MRRLTTMVYALNFAFLLLALPQLARADEPQNEAGLALMYGDKYGDQCCDNSVISVATGSALTLWRAPAVATLITTVDLQTTGTGFVQQPFWNLLFYSTPL